MLVPEEDDVLMPCFPHARGVKEATSLSDEEFVDLVEAAPTSSLPTHEDKEMVIFSHTNGI
jgi:hypothetical protein